MDLNLTVLAGKLAAEPEVKLFESGSLLARFLVTVRTEEPRRRIDVLPVVLWEPDEGLIDAIAEGGLRGTRIWVAGSVQRRFWATSDQARTSRIEVVAHDVRLQKEQEELEEDEGFDGS